MSVPFNAICRAWGLPEPVPEYRFHPVRRWRFDWAWPDRLVALEVNGGVFTAGRHSRGVGQTKDFEKWSHAAVAGWRLLHVTPRDLAGPQTLALLEAVFHARPDVGVVAHRGAPRPGAAGRDRPMADRLHRPMNARQDR